jgi:hypothetical protein
VALVFPSASSGSQLDWPLVPDKRLLGFTPGDYFSEAKAGILNSPDLSSMFGEHCIGGQRVEH